MIYKKSVVLSSIIGGNEKAVISLEYDGGDIVGTCKLYNFKNEPDGILSLGILNNNEVIKAGLSKESNMSYKFKLGKTIELNSFSCALVNFVHGEAKPLLQGATTGSATNEERLANSLSIFENDATVENVKQTLDHNEIYLEDQAEIENIIDKEINKTEACDRCGDCKYRDAFYKLEDDAQTIEERDKTEDSFFEGIKGQIDTLFDKYPEEEILKEIIPNSKWAKIDYEEKGEYYVVGLLYENDEIKYVCYGVPSIYSDVPPKELSGIAQWLPIDSSKEKGFGYWITYQDAVTGENIKLSYETI